MLSIFFAIILILFLIKLLRDSLYLAWLWQIKEYRIDRMASRLKEDKNIFKNNLFYIFAVVIFISYLIFLKNIQLVFQYLVLVFFIIAFLQTIKEIKNRSLKRPKPTLKIVLIFLLLIIIYSMIAFCWISSFFATKETISAIRISSSGFELMFFVLIVNPILISSIVFALNPFFNFQKRRLIKKASLKMKNLKKIKVIGITGSYGKTSTKEFLYVVLSQKYKAVKTEGNNNTNIGVAYTVLNKVSDEYDYFICEMGAYKIGEIAEICDIVNPKIGILTGINEQHIELFGSIENTIKAKFELIKALPENGLAVLNGDNEHIKSEIENWNNCFNQKIKFFRIKSISQNIKVKSDCVEFIYKGEKFKVNILGKHYIENILSVIAVAEEIGMSLKEIKSALEKIKSTKFMMKKLNGLNNSVFIDDSYSANPDGVMAALDYLNEAYPDYKKIIIFSGIIELGSKSDEVHQKLFNRIIKVCDVAYALKTKNWKFETGNKCKFIFEKDFDKVVEMVKNDLNKNNYFSKEIIPNKKTVVLFEGRGAGVVMGKL